MTTDLDALARNLRDQEPAAAFEEAAFEAYRDETRVVLDDGSIARMSNEKWAGYNPGKFLKNLVTRRVDPDLFEEGFNFPTGARRGRLGWG